MPTLQTMAKKPSFNDISKAVELLPDGSIRRITSHNNGKLICPKESDRAQYVSVCGIQIRYCELKYMLENGKWPPERYFVTNIGGGNKIRISENHPLRIAMKNLFKKKFKRMPDPLRNVKNFVVKKI